MKRIVSILLSLIMLATCCSYALADQLNELKVAPDKGIADTINYVNQLDAVQTVLYTGAHPDDESNSLLVYLNHVLGANCTELSAHCAPEN